MLAHQVVHITFRGVWFRPSSTALIGLEVTLVTGHGVQGGAVSASDISSSMANEAQRRYEQAVSSGEAPAATPPTFSATDLESISGSFHTVVCLDVMIHYPQV